MTVLCDERRCDVNEYGELYREALIAAAIKKAKPSWFSSFSICPVNDVAEVLGVYKRNDAYNLLGAIHCWGYWGIPKIIRRRIPELIRVALQAGVFDATRRVSVQDLERLVK